MLQIKTMRGITSINEKQQKVLIIDRKKNKNKQKTKTNRDYVQGALSMLAINIIQTKAPWIQNMNTVFNDSTMTMG